MINASQSQHVAWKGQGQATSFGSKRNQKPCGAGTIMYIYLVRVRKSTVEIPNIRRILWKPFKVNLEPFRRGLEVITPDCEGHKKTKLIMNFFPGAGGKAKQNATNTGALRLGEAFVCRLLCELLFRLLAGGGDVGWFRWDILCEKLFLQAAICTGGVDELAAPTSLYARRTAGGWSRSSLSEQLQVEGNKRGIQLLFGVTHTHQIPTVAEQNMFTPERWVEGEWDPISQEGSRKSVVDAILCAYGDNQQLKKIGNALPFFPTKRTWHVFLEMSKSHLNWKSAGLVNTMRTDSLGSGGVQHSWLQRGIALMISSSSSLLPEHGGRGAES